MKLYTAVRDTRVHAHLIHDADRQRLQQRMVCPQDEAVVDQEQTIKGYEIEENQYVVVDPRELEVLEPEASRDIEVMEFVGAGKVDARYLDRTYFLGPDQDEPMYVNLAESLKQTGLAGMCRWVMRGRSYVGVLEQRDGLLSLITHRYADEVVPADSLEFKRVEPTKKEATIAKNLVEELTEEKSKAPSSKQAQMLEITNSRQSPVSACLCCHSREGGNPCAPGHFWTPACAGVTGEGTRRLGHWNLRFVADCGFGISDLSSRATRWREK